MKAVTASGKKKSIFSSLLKVVQKFMKNLGRRQRKQNDAPVSDELLLVGWEAYSDVSTGKSEAQP